MTPPDYEALSKGISRDMSPQAIAERLRIASELYDLASVLEGARCLGRVEPPVTGPEDAPHRDPPEARRRGSEDTGQTPPG